jgi:protein-S-isoprenylcysteine O-methyltransferase Ste14
LGYATVKLNRKKPLRHAGSPPGLDEERPHTPGQKKEVFNVQLLVYSTLCLGFGLGPILLGWVNEWLRPAIWLAGVLTYRLVEESGYNPSQTRGERRAEWLFLALYLGIGGAVLLPAIEFAAFQRPLIVPCLVGGMACVALGTLLRWLGVRTLGAHFSTHVEVRQEHRLIDAGIYRYIRHPGYAGVISFSLGSALILHSWYCLLFLALYFWPLVCVRMAIEERELSAKLDGYAEYCQRSHRLVPFLL